MKVERVALFSGIGILLTYNVLLVMMENILDLSFSGDREVNDNGLLFFNSTLLVSVLILLFVKSVDIYFMGVLIAGFLILAGTIICQVCLWPHEKDSGGNPVSFYMALGIMGFATGLSQVGQFAVVASLKGPDSSSKLADTISMGIGTSGLLVWIIGVLTQYLFTDAETRLVNRSALLTLLGLSALATLASNILFTLILWPIVKEENCEAKPVQYMGGEDLATSQDPLYSETVLHSRTATYAGIEDSEGIVREGQEDLVDFKISRASMKGGLGGWDVASVYIILMFLVLFVTLFCFPSIAPLRWRAKSATIWYMGVFQFADVLGRQLAKMTRKEIPMFTLSATSLARLGLIGWSIYEAVAVENVILSRLACMIAIGGSSSYLFTILMRQGTTQVRPEIAATTSTLMLLALMIGVNAGLYACKCIIARITVHIEAINEEIVS